MKKSLTIIRWIVGLLFIFSGLIKANDPLGLSYKMQEFFEAWGMQSFYPLTLSLSIGMNVFELLLGVAMILGYRMRLFSWLILLLTVFFGFLTGYAALSGKFKSCGCFGDCLPLEPEQSFLKDVFLLILVLIIFIYRKRIQPAFKSAITSVIILAATVLLGIGLQSYTLKHLPVLDCLPYRQGNHLLEQMKVPAGAVSDSFAITFSYKKDGKIVEFDALHFPADFDSTYIYVDRYDKLVRKGNATPKITDFALKSADGIDSTQALLGSNDRYIMVMIKSFDDWSQRKAGFEQVLQAARQHHIPLLVATPAAGDASTYLPASDMLRVFQLDAVVEKTAARANPTYFLMKGDLVLEKESYADVDQFKAAILGKEVGK